MSKHQKKTKGTKQRADPLALPKGVRLTDSSPFKLEQPHVVSSGPGHVVVRGTSFWDTVKSQPAVGDIITWTYLRPNIGGDTWLKRLSQLYDKYRFNSATVCYYPIVAHTTPGAIVMCYDVDPADYLPAGEEALVEASAHRTNVLNQVGDRAVMKLKLDNKIPYLYCHEAVDEESLDVRFQSQGWICVNQISPESDPVTFGVLTINYEIEFRDPSIEYSEPVAPGMIPIETFTPPPAGAVNLAARLANVAKNAVLSAFPAGLKVGQEAWKIPAGTYADLSTMLKTVLKYTTTVAAAGPADVFFWWEAAYKLSGQWVYASGVFENSPHLGELTNVLGAYSYKSSVPVYTTGSGFIVEVAELLAARVENNLATDVWIAPFMICNASGVPPNTIDVQSSPYLNYTANFTRIRTGLISSESIDVPTSSGMRSKAVLCGASPISLDRKAGSPESQEPIGKAASAPPLYTDPHSRAPSLVLPKAR